MTTKLNINGWTKTAKGVYRHISGVKVINRIYGWEVVAPTKRDGEVYGTMNTAMIVATSQALRS